MFIERKINSVTGKVEFWRCEWDNSGHKKAKKNFIKKVCDEKPPISTNDTAMSKTPAICWAYGRTLGNIAVYSQQVLGSFSSNEGTDATLPCSFQNAGKFRHGEDRLWCTTHQMHWGTKADKESLAQTKVMICANHTQKMNYVLKPREFNVSEHKQVGIWCSLPAAFSSKSIPRRPPQIHVHVRNDKNGKKVIDKDFNAVSILCNNDLPLFANKDISRINISPPAAFEFVRALEEGQQTDCIDCSHCRYPHLDLGDFGKTPHRKHFCANCGRDSTWSKKPIISTPLKPLHDAFPQSSVYEEAKGSINIDDYKGCDYEIWASTPAIVWSSDKPQQKGIHVHIYDGKNYKENETFSEVIFNGKKLNRKTLLEKMFEQTIV